jgi:ABC-2 type transport system ATP-binding protein
MTRPSRHGTRPDTRAGAAPRRPPVTRPAIEVAGLSKRFGPTVAVDGLSFTASYGRITGFLGPNGAGKTTTLRALLGLIRPDGGTAAINGHGYAELADPVRTVGALLDNGAAHPGRTGRDHLRVLARAAGIPESRVEELLTRVGLRHAAGQRAGGYSLGMRQRLGLAVMLLGDPQVLVLDEPANGLDPQGIRWLRDLLRSQAAEGRAILVSSHVLAEVSQTADDIVVISGGRCVLQEPLDRMLTEHLAGVRVAGPDSQLLGEILRAQGAQVIPDGPGCIAVRDRSVAEIGRLVAARQLVISELSQAGSSLEDIYLELTGNPDGGPS